MQGLPQCLCFWAKVTFSTETCFRTHTQADPAGLLQFFGCVPPFSPLLCPVCFVCCGGYIFTDAGTSDTHTSTLLRRVAAMRTTLASNSGCWPAPSPALRKKPWSFMQTFSHINSTCHTVNEETKFTAVQFRKISYWKQILSEL